MPCLSKLFRADLSQGWGGQAVGAGDPARALQPGLIPTLWGALEGRFSSERVKVEPPLPHPGPNSGTPACLTRSWKMSPHPDVEQVGRTGTSRPAAVPSPVLGDLG